MTQAALGFVGLGNMGGPMAARLVEAGHDLLVFDAAGTAERAPVGARAAAECAQMGAAETVLLSLPDGPVVLEVAAQLIAASPRSVTTIVDFSTTGIDAARAIGALLAEAGIEFVDAPVSGGTAGAKAGTLAIMAAATEETFGRLAPVFDAVAAKVFRVGEEAGQGQAMKLLNNFLSATAMAATSEAATFGQRQGLDLETMLAVLNASTGQNTATGDKFPRRVLTGSFDSGFATRLMAKDVALYRDSVAAVDCPGRLAETVDAIWQGCLEALPESDFTEVYRYVRGNAETD